MRPTSVRVSAAGFSDWVPLNRYSSAFGVGLGVVIPENATLTVTVQHTFDNLYTKYTDFSASRVTTTVTVTQVNHGLKTGDWVKITNAGAPFDGEFAVASTADFDTFTYTVADSGAASAGGNRVMQKARVFNHAVLAGLTASADSNYSQPPTATRLSCSAYTDGFADLMIVSGGK